MLSIKRRLKDSQKTLLGINIYLLKLSGIWKPHSTFYKILSVSYVFIYGVFNIFQYIDFFKAWGEWDYMFMNLSLTYACMLGLIKIISFRLNFHLWEAAFDAMNEIEKKFNNKDHPAIRAILAQFTFRMRFTTIGFISTCFITLIFFCLEPIIMNAVNNDKSQPLKQIAQMWSPFSLETNLGYMINIFIQLITSFLCGLVSSVYDTSVVAVLVWFHLQLVVLRKECSSLGVLDDSDKSGELFVSEEEFLKRLKQCHNHHLALLRSYHSFNTLQSPIMFVSLLGCTIVLGYSVINLTGNSNILSGGLYFISTFIELFMLYWFYNDVTVMSQKVSSGVWESHWYRYSVRSQRLVLVLMQGLNTRMVFSAGPFNDMTLVTFLGILKTSYSAYAALSNI
ncbi:odorant receptor Or2-like [Plutella xylostella]|uniref:odorant receptor Or2-like n=1 Tax=Plutella xylostella TaxID=51655 RepID=UPI00203247D6|nr:odorant receptor Or2-like [Plutella xylostella]